MLLHQYSKGDLQTLYTKQKYISYVSTYETVILLLFNKRSSWTVEQIQDETQIDIRLFLQVLCNLLKSKLITCSDINDNKLEENLNENDIKMNYNIHIANDFNRSNYYDDAVGGNGAAVGDDGPAVDGALFPDPIGDIFTDDSSGSSASSFITLFLSSSSSSPSARGTFSGRYILLSVAISVCIIGIYVSYVENNGRAEISKTKDQQAEEFKKPMEGKLQKLESAKENLKHVLQANVEKTKAPIEKDLANVQQNLAKLEEDRQVLQEKIVQELNTAELEQLDRLIEILDQLKKSLNEY
ncbi:unnamed protein product [Rotaria sordida]|uniref:Cullin family profile domain-containing protein n=1 Tax=Rotaria sordida TaxID=392033 RepID=A0A815KRN9_9BILA|nr:unnamed protein product [Rotaria sordida]CAF1622710.1 unnamed protein product [Rotaria sordida]